MKGVRAAAVFALLLTLGLPLAAQEKSDEEDEFRHPARQNPILREYFREQYLDMKQFGPYGSSRRQPRELPSDTFMDRFIDKRIDHFIQDLEKRMEAIQEEIESVRQSGLALKQASARNAQLRRALKKQLGSLSDDLGSLHKTLAILLVKLKSKADFEQEVDAGPENAGFCKEIEYISGQYSQAAKQIADYFLKPSFTVSMHQLQGENLLIQLHRANKMARELEKFL